MASQMVVAPSKDTLFVRGFSSRKDVEDVRDFFEKEARSKVMIEFLKQTEQDDRLFVALRFDSKDVAKDVLLRYDNTEVLGDNITLTWFKDLRRARYKGPNRQDNRRQRYDNYDNYGHSYNRYGNNNRNRTDNRHRNRSSRRYSRSQSRSLSRSRSRSRSRERERDRRAESRSPSPHPRHKLKSEVQTASRHKGDDSDIERSPQLQDSSISPERAYTSEPSSPVDERVGKVYLSPHREISKHPTSQQPDVIKSNRDRRNEINKESHEDDLDYKDESPNRYHNNRESFSESFEESRYPNDKYTSSSRQQNRSQHQSRYDEDNRAQEPPSKSRYISDVDERALMEGRWGSRDRDPIDPSPSRMSDGIDRMSNASIDRDRVLASNMERLPSSMDMDGGGGIERKSDSRMGRGPSDRGGSGRMEQDDRRRGYDHDNTMGESGNQGRRNEGFYGQGQMEERKVSQRSSQGGSGGKGADPDRWLGLDGGQMGVGEKWAGGQVKEDSVISGWSPQAMQLIQDKKDDIEKVYKNDCETFVSVVKMLISKDPQLEDRLQHSLRENLKEIGQRCILELREYIDRLKEKEEGVIGGPMGVV